MYVFYMLYVFLLHVKVKVLIYLIRVHVCTHTRVYVCTYMYVYTYMYSSTYVSDIMCTCMYVMYVPVCVHMYVYMNVVSINLMMT